MHTRERAHCSGFVFPFIKKEREREREIEREKEGRKFHFFFFLFVRGVLAGDGGLKYGAGVSGVGGWVGGGYVCGVGWCW